jgi:hypothetical protein
MAAAALVMPGCIPRDTQSVEATGNLIAARLADKQAAEASEPAPKPAAPAGRFTNLPKRPPAATETKTPPAPPLPGQVSKAAPRPAGFVDPLTKSSSRIPITLESCIRRAIAGNLSIQIARFGPAIAQTAVREAEAIFDPSWFLNDALNRVKQRSPSIFTGSGTFIDKQSNFATGLSTLAPTGATIQLSQDWTYQNSNQARLHLVQTSDHLKRLLHDAELPLQEPTVLEAAELPVASPMPVGREVLQASMLDAMKYRPEIQEAENRLSQAGVRERVAQNARLPQLDLSAGYNLNGLNPRSTGRSTMSCRRVSTTGPSAWSSASRSATVAARRPTSGPCWNAPAPSTNGRTSTSGSCWR